MSNIDYQLLMRAFPRTILFPAYGSICRPMPELLGQVRHINDLPERLLLGNLAKDSFRCDRDNNWVAEWRNDSWSRAKVTVEHGRFHLEAFFLDESASAFGNIAQIKGIWRMMALMSPAKWFDTLRTHLASVPGIVVPNDPVGGRSFFCIPDGWMCTILVPVCASRLTTLLALHRILLNLCLQSAPYCGRVDLLPSTVQYAPGTAQLETAGDLLARQAVLSHVPPLPHHPQLVSAQGGDRWQLSRLCYLYRCDCFLRDIPKFVHALHAAGLLSAEPELCAAVLPTTGDLGNRTLAWRAPGDAVSINWHVDRPYLPEVPIAGPGDSYSEAKALARRAHELWQQYQAARVETNLEARVQASP